MPDYGLTDEGYIAPRAADFLSLIRSQYEADTGLTIDWGADVFLGTITASMADQLGDLAEASQAVYDAWDPNNATGLQLDNLSLIANVPREAATYSTATVTCTGTSGTILPEGREIEGGGTDGRARWRSTADATIGGGGTVSVVFQAVDAGAVEGGIAALDQIVTPVSGWTSCTNPAVATVGEDRETDAELRVRRQQSLQVSGSRSLNALRSNVLQVDGVQAAVVVDNPTTTAATIQGISVAAIGVAVTVYPSTLTTAQKEDLAETIYDHVAGGVATSGSASAIVTGVDGYSKTVNWYYATTQAVTVEVVVVLDEGYELGDVDDVIEDLFTDYFLALTVGEAARRLAGFALIATVEGVTSATLTFNTVAADVSPDLTKLLTLTSTTVSE